jgi:hypothetical protein
MSIEHDVDLLPGTYIGLDPTYGRNTSYSIGIYECEDTTRKLPMKYLPDGYPNSEIKQVSIFGNDLEGKETILIGDNTYLVKATSEYVTVDDLIGCTMSGVLNGVNMSVILDSTMVMDLTQLGIPGIGIIIDDNLAFVSVSQDTNIGREITTGTWYMYVPGVAYIKSISYFPDITKEVITKLDIKYLPDDLGNGLPKVTTENDGAFLRVVDGGWAPVKIPNVRDGEF